MLLFSLMLAGTRLFKHKYRLLLQKKNATNPTQFRCGSQIFHCCNFKGLYCVKASTYFWLYAAL